MSLPGLRPRGGREEWVGGEPGSSPPGTWRPHCSSHPILGPHACRASSHCSLGPDRPTCPCEALVLRVSAVVANSMCPLDQAQGGPRTGKHPFWALTQGASRRD